MRANSLRSAVAGGADVTCVGTARAYTSARSIGFCAIWVCISSSSSSAHSKVRGSSWTQLHCDPIYHDPIRLTIRFLATMPPVYGASNPPALAAVIIANSVSAPTNLLLFGTRNSLALF